jgi:hypothetical protein
MVEIKRTQTRRIEGVETLIYLYDFQGQTRIGFVSENGSRSYPVEEEEVEGFFDDEIMDRDYYDGEVKELDFDEN